MPIVRGGGIPGRYGLPIIAQPRVSFPIPTQPGSGVRFGLPILPTPSFRTQPMPTGRAPVKFTLPILNPVVPPNRFFPMLRGK